MESEEQRLVSAAQHGDLDAFNQLVRLYEARVYTLCYRMMSDADAAADIAQETFIAAYTHLGRYRGGQFKSWLLRIATNACLDALRARKRRPATSLNAFSDRDDGAELEIVDPGESPDESVLRGELGRALADSLAHLPEDQRLMVILSDIQGLAYDEIAQVTGVALGTVKSRLSRGRARLRDMLRRGELLPQKYRLYDN
jgi:RNA polymerase sigma factor (sigma-70 family)